MSENIDPYSLLNETLESIHIHIPYATSVPSQYIDFVKPSPKGVYRGTTTTPIILDGDTYHYINKKTGRFVPKTDVDFLFNNKQYNYYDENLNMIIDCNVRSYLKLTPHGSLHVNLHKLVMYLVAVEVDALLSSNTGVIVSNDKLEVYADELTPLGKKLVESGQLFAPKGIDLSRIGVLVNKYRYHMFSIVSHGDRVTINVHPDSRAFKYLESKFKPEEWFSKKGDDS